MADQACCSNCRCSHDAGSDLLCRRFPPVPAPVLKPGSCEIVNATSWPIVKPFEWCGEHRYA